MERHLDHDLDLIRQQLLQMGAAVEEMVADAMRSLTEHDLELASEVVERDRTVDALEKEIDEHCLSALARHQPTAIDLRFLVSVMNIVNDLERTGDSAKSIARSVGELEELLPQPLRSELERLARSAREMVRRSLDAFVHRDAELARAIWRRDDEIDVHYESLSRTLLARASNSPERAGDTFHELLVAQNLERIADHATNICESVIFLIEAHDIRHSATKYGGVVSSNP
jgi:phosphate transport system protein